ncbi:hypothetical protein L596_010712 [Steinernema carpocapsae]|uniref:Uncharacterized protein n=1 Tax=Steinernema carpocapsae TaxID=34508 RepID=A0A4U5PKZ0_STECR|nr:hypothetical protein L596_010712 [Steinernema carpocapsae]
MGCFGVWRPRVLRPLRRRLFLSRCWFRNALLSRMTSIVVQIRNLALFKRVVKELIIRKCCSRAFWLLFT